VYDDKSERYNRGGGLKRSETSSDEEENDEVSEDSGLEKIGASQKSGRKFLDSLRNLYERRVKEALDLADHIR